MAALFVAGCSSPLLVWQARTPDPSPQARVEVVVDDVRPERRGGRDHRWIGQELSAFGLPMHLRLSDELEASRRMKALVAGALASRAIGAPVANGFAKVRLGVELAELWCAPAPAGERGPFLAQVALVMHALHMPRGEVWHSERLAARVDGAANCAVALRLSLIHI